VTTEKGKIKFEIEDEIDTAVVTNVN
jgi:hypothetical protein